jgi:hypothetical protein
MSDHGFRRVEKGKDHWLLDNDHVYCQILAKRTPPRHRWIPGDFEVELNIAAKIDPRSGIPPPVLAHAERAHNQPISEVYGWLSIDRKTAVEAKICPNHNSLSIITTIGGGILNVWRPFGLGLKLQNSTTMSDDINNIYWNSFTDNFYFANSQNKRWVDNFFDDFIFRLPLAVRSIPDLDLLWRRNIDVEGNLECKWQRARWLATGEFDYNAIENMGYEDPNWEYRKEWTIQRGLTAYASHPLLRSAKLERAKPLYPD